MSFGMMRTNVGAKGKAQPHYNYIMAEGRYTKKADEIEYKENGNLPRWAKDNPGELWECADLFERKNGSTYREHVIGLPRELNPEQRLKLVKEWVVNEMGTDKPYSLAIHNKIASDGQEQPHLHLMFCERINDGIPRTPQQYFKRYNAKAPAKGGARKDNTGKTAQQRDLEIKAQRLRWQELANRHLVEAGFEPSVDVRNWKDKGLDEPPQNKPMWQWQAEKRADKLLETIQSEVVPTYHPTPKQPLNEPYEPRNDSYDGPSPF